MTIPRRRRRSAARACTQTSRAPQETSARARPGPHRRHSGVFAWSGPRSGAGSQSDWQNSPRQNFFAGFERGLFRRLAAPRRPLIGRPDSNGLNQARNYVASLRSPGGRAGARSKSVPYRVIIQRPKAQIAVRARTRARNPASYTPRRRLAEDDGLRAKEAPAAGTDSRARAGLNRENNSTSHHGGQEARRTPRSCCECRRGMSRPGVRRERITLLAFFTPPTPRRAFWTRRAAAAPRAARIETAPSHRQRRRIDRRRARQGLRFQ